MAGALLVESPSHESGLGGKSGYAWAGLESLLRSDTALP